MSTFRQLLLLGALVLALSVEGGSQEPIDEPPEVITSFTSAGTVEFPHALHASDLEFECATCHHETNAVALSIPHPEYFDDFWIECGTCHRAGASPASAQACSACHHSSPATISDETLSAKVVIHRSCFGCHEGGTGKEAARSCGFCHQAKAPEIEDAVTETGGV